MRFQGTIRFCLAVFALSAVACGVFAVVHNAHRARIFHQLDYEEGNILNTAVRINHGLTPYPDPHEWPVVINPYGPLPYYLVAGVAHFSGPSFTPPRYLIITAAVLCALLIGLLIYHFARSLLLSAGFAGVFLSHQLTQAWMPVLRVDFIVLAIVLLALYLFVHFPKRWSVALALLALAVFSKFSFLAAPCTCFCWLLLQRKWKQSIQFAIGGCALLALFFGTAILVSRGFAYDVFMTHGGPMLWSNLGSNYYLAVRSDPLIAGLAFVALVWALATKRFEFPVLYAIFALLESLTAAKVGSNMNHLVELLAAFCILSGWFVGQMLERRSALSLAAAAVTSALGVYALLYLPNAPIAAPIPGCIPAYEWAAQVNSDRILSDNVGLLVVSKKTVWVSNPFAYLLLSNSGKAPDTPLQERIRNKWFDYIVLGDLPQNPSTRWSPAVRNLIMQNYVLIARSSCREAFWVYAPAPANAGINATATQEQPVR